MASLFIDSKTQSECLRLLCLSAQSCLRLHRVDSLEGALWAFWDFVVSQGSLSFSRIRGPKASTNHHTPSLCDQVRTSKFLRVAMCPRIHFWLRLLSTFWLLPLSTSSSPPYTWFLGGSSGIQVYRWYAIIQSWGTSDLSSKLVWYNSIESHQLWQWSYSHTFYTISQRNKRNTACVTEPCACRFDPVKLILLIVPIEDGGVALIRFLWSFWQRPFFFVCIRASGFCTRRFPIQAARHWPPTDPAAALVALCDFDTPFAWLPP